MTEEYKKRLFEDKAKQMWIRARSNAFANKEALKKYSKINTRVFYVSSLAVILPILLNSILLATYQNGAITEVTSNDGSNINLLLWLTIGIAFFNSIVLFCSLVSDRQRWSEKAIEHGKFMAGYQQIAQRVRRFDNLDKVTDEDIYLMRHLEENFELWKSIGIEPSHEDFLAADELMRKLNSYPFGLTTADFINSQHGTEPAA